jgi:small subunit ribosomal protein S4e
MPRGPKKHLKRLVAPKSWVLDKLGGVFSVKPSSGPHKMGESLPIAIFLRLGLSTAWLRPEPSTTIFLVS